MVNQSRRYQTQWTAQFYVAAELTRRGYLVAFTLGNAPATDLLVTDATGDVHFRVDVKGQSTRNFWLIRSRESEPDLYYILVYLPRNLDERPRYFVLDCAELMVERAGYRAGIESASGRYRDDMGGINWGTAFKYEDRWECLPRGRRPTDGEAPGGGG